METEVSEVRKALYRGDRVGAEGLARAQALNVFDAAVARNDMRVQPLHSAAALGDVDAVRALLDAGADPNAEQQGGFRPLDEALLTENTALAALLRERGAKVSGNPLK